MQQANSSYLPVLTGELFAALYNPVEALVFAVEISDAKILVGNSAFWTSIPFDTNELSATTLFPAQLLQQPKTGEKIPLTLQLPGTGPLPVRMQLLDAVLDGEKVILCIATPAHTAEKSTSNALEVAEAEKKALLNEVYHRVKNNLNIIVSLLSLQLSRVQEQSVHMMLLESKSRVYTLALLHEFLYLSPRVAEIKAGDYLLKLSNSVFTSFRKPSQHVRLIADMTDAWLNVDILLPLGLICHELVANAVQHAFATEATGEIRISFCPLPNGDFEFMVTDNGSGFPEGVNFGNGNTLGQKLIVNLSKQLKGQLLVASNREKGTAVTLQFSIAGK